ncbi:hypothetical protein ACFQZ4_54420 [Catellatospora coxensis]|uniref:Uncharacterized protein n=1 Tax=Catellatospora coxensis TaxID=310354 RepID=A0A8J3PB86_9ACTN|nr:hypothetical protein [Catellatospora coxensis]GIG11056.1 hypothetical protein Cco03nite_77560 [Catellatospora coxensis]
MALDLEVARRLAYIRYLHQLGIDQGKLPPPMSSVALLMLHDAIESYYLLAGEHLGTTGSYDFDGYPAAINAKLPTGTSITGKQAMKRLNKARVALKHHGLHPDPAAIDLAVSDAATFMAANTPLIFGVDYETVSMADVITQQQIRDLVKAAETSSAAGDRIDAMCSLAHAMQQLLMPHSRGNGFDDPSPFQFSSRFTWPLSEYDIKEALSPPRIRGGDSRLRLEAHRNTDRLARQIKDNADTLKKVTELVRLVAMGFDRAGYERFKRLTPVVRMYSTEYEFAAVKGYDPSAEEYQFCHQFVIGCAIRFSAIEANLSSPTWWPPRHQREWEPIKRIKIGEGDD